jgi:hypothetical protein
MDGRIVIGVTLGLVLLAFGGFYFALSSRSSNVVVPPAKVATAPAPQSAAPGKSAAQAPAAQAPTAQAPAAQVPAAQAPAPAAPPKATPASIEAEIAQSDHAELQVLLKKNFADDYNQLIAVAVKQRNDGVSDQQFGQELFARFQDIMRNKLKYAVGASTPMIDKLASNETSLFHALGTEAAGYCLKLLGKDTSPATAPPPDNVRQMMRLGTLYRFQAIVEGMPNFKAVDPLTADDMRAFEASLGQDGMRFDEVRSGAFLNKAGDQPGQPCLMLEKLYRAIARLPEATRRKIYAGMFFLGRDK